MYDFARSPTVGFPLLFAVLVLTACSATQPVATATPTASATPLKATETIPSTVAHSPTPKPTVRVGLAPTPNLKPTIDPTILPNKLMTELKLVAEPGTNGYSVQRITGWEYGFSISSGFYGRNYSEPVSWLDNAHLLLEPVTGESWGRGVAQQVQPVVVNLVKDRFWLPPTRWSSDLYWSAALNELIVIEKNGFTRYDSDGQVLRTTKSDGRYYYLSPSGQRLLAVSKTGDTWYDLTTNQVVNIEANNNPGSVGWSPDETHLFDENLCLIDADVGKITCMNFKLDVFGGEGISTIYWVTGDKVMLDWPGFYEGTPAPDNPPLVLLIDPLNATYQDVRTLAGFDKSTNCGFTSIFSPDHNNIWLECDQKSYVIDLLTFSKQAVPTDLEFDSWSPDSKFALAQQIDQNCCKKPYRYAMYSLLTTEAYSVTLGVILSPTWSTTGSLLAYLAEDRQQLGVLDAATQDIVQAALPQPVVNIYWQPQNQGIVVQGDDNSLWWIADPAVNRIEQLTAPLPAVRDVKWSPNGDRLAFVSGTDVYVVTVSK